MRHALFEGVPREGPYDPGKVKGGVDTVIKSLEDNEVPPNSNVYAELGTTWRSVMGEPDQTAQLLGKLFKYVGEDNVLWGTDSIWYGSPQDQILAFRSFEIAAEFQERWGYPARTPELNGSEDGCDREGNQDDKTRAIDPRAFQRPLQDGCSVLSAPPVFNANAGAPKRTL